MDLRALLASLRSQIGLDALVELKKSSGAGLGNVSDAEGARLERSLSNINPDEQSTASLIRSFEDLKAGLQRTRERLERQYQEEFIEQRGRQAPVAQGGQGTTANRKTISRAEVQKAFAKTNAMLQEAGQAPMTMQDFEAQMQRNHWQIGE
jgi:hypothetical protein